MPDQTSNKLVVNGAVFEKYQLKLVDPVEWDENQINLSKLKTQKNDKDARFKK